MSNEQTQVNENDPLELIELVSNDKVEEALSRFYHEDFRAFENSEGPRIGIKKTLERISGGHNEIKVLYYLNPSVWMIRGNQSMIQWKCEYQDPDGKHWYAEEVNMAKWKNGKIKEEQYVCHLPKMIEQPSHTTFIWKNNNL